MWEEGGETDGDRQRKKERDNPRTLSLDLDAWCIFIFAHLELALCPLTYCNHVPVCFLFLGANTVTKKEFAWLMLPDHTPSLRQELDKGTGGRDRREDYKRELLAGLLPRLTFSYIIFLPPRTSAFHCGLPPHINHG